MQVPRTSYIKDEKNEMVKNRKILYKILCMGLTISGVLLTACDIHEEAIPKVTQEITGEVQEEQQVTEESRHEMAEEKVQEESLVTDEMYDRATKFLEGDLTRLAAVMRRAEQGEEIVIGVIGGSITEQYSASSYAKCYAYLVQKAWEKRFPNAKISLVNAGVGGTNSYLGVHRVESDLLVEEPDFVIVEFSVNDGNDAFYKKSYDNLVRRIMKDENNPAVMLLFTTQEDGTSAQENDSAIGFKYRLPMISYGNAVLPEIEAGNMKWTDISPDNIHPNDTGHAMIAELIAKYLDDVYARLDKIDTEITPFTERALTVESYAEAKMENAATLVPVSMGSFEVKQVNSYFKDNWYTCAGEEAIVFEVEASNIGIAYQRTIDGTYGQFDVYIDGNFVTTVDGNFKNGWGTSIETVELYTSKEKTTHEIRIQKNGNSTGDLFTLISLLIS